MHNRNEKYLTLSYFNKVIDESILAYNVRRMGRGVEHRIQEKAKNLAIIPLEDNKKLLYIYVALTNINLHSLFRSYNLTSEDSFSELKQQLNNLLTHIGVTKL